MREGAGYVYIMASGRNGTIYTGSTVDLGKRAWEHRNGVIPGFTERYRCRLLVWYEVHDTIDDARLRERQIKEWKRAWKVRRIEEVNVGWDDLFDTLV